MKNNCPKWNASSSGGSTNEPKKEENQVEESVSEFIEDEVLVVRSNQAFQQYWIMDSGATHHMCPHRS